MEKDPSLWHNICNQKKKDEELKKQVREISGDCLPAHLNLSVNLVCVKFLLQQLKAVELSKLAHT